MSGDTRITGQIRIDPPITWRELVNAPWARGKETNHHPDAVVKVDERITDTPDGELHHHLGTAIVPTGHETSGYTLLADVNRIVKRFGDPADGPTRTFTGFEATYRVVVRDGAAVEVRPEIAWPADAQDVTP
jgi:hypothetical protein